MEDNEIKSKNGYSKMVASYPILHNMIRLKRERLLKITPEDDLINQHAQLKNIFDELENASNDITTSLSKTPFSTDMGQLISGLKNQQLAIKKVQSTTQEIVDNLLKDIKY